jgi:hypothetical protein
MMTYGEARDRLNDCQYLYLETFGRGARGLDLCVELIEARSQPAIEAAGNDIVENILGPRSPIMPDESSARFTLVFENYLAFSIINESYAQGDGERSAEAPAGKTAKRIDTYAKSHFRDYVSAVTFATDAFPGPQRHFEISCLDHILNVICRDNPTITVSMPRTALETTSP